MLIFESRIKLLIILLMQSSPSLPLFVPCILWSMLTDMDFIQVHSMPPPLQVLTMGCAVAIIAAKAFWLKPGAMTSAQEIRASSELFIQSQTLEHVKVAVLEAFQDVAGPYETDQYKMLQQIALNNQI
ncbi:hypothetical protein BOTBODRAFT_221667 [Botryobasidium botryosum FD-172 SS1]|uniref:Uncharacterized protein n=1 Tax=Botryobasidium botryosum (strain FD-172 SS1) TaxID=930990 RepID=A0A067MN59_BOTB1|nr:hypothetical protein BOTBODRAFT_221667 [Botryobasidium botryosum FD-172 SS1]